MASSGEVKKTVCTYSNQRREVDSIPGNRPRLPEESEQLSFETTCRWRPEAA